MTEEEKSLADKVAERKDLLRKIVRFVERIITKHGHVTSKIVGHHNTHIVSEFEQEFFRFVTDKGQSSMGGNNIVVWYEGKEALNIRHRSCEFNADHCTVETFDETTPWLKHLLKVMENPRWGTGPTLKDRAKDVRRNLRESRREKKELMTREEAKRLKIIE